MERKGKNDKKDGRKLLLDLLQLIGTSVSDGVPNYRGMFQLGPD
jgi:hypothetical protein